MMTFGSRRMTIRNRKHLRKFKPVNTPANMPLGLPKNSLLSSPPIQRRNQPPPQIKEYDLPSPPPTQRWEQPQVPNQPTEPVAAHPQEAQTQSLPTHLQVQQHHQEPVQAHPLVQHNHFPDYLQEDNRLGIPETNIDQENNVNTSPNSQDISIHQQVPGPDHSPSLRRSARTTRGQTSRYDDFVQTIFPVCSPPQIPSSYLQYQYPQMMNNQTMTNLMMPNHLMTNNLMQNQMMNNQLSQPTMLWYY